VFFITWFRRAYRNLPVLGAAGLRYRSGWTIGCWFIPIAGLIIPKQIANDIWRASDPSAPPEQGVSWRTRAVPPLLTFWWILWIASIYVGNQELRTAFSEDTPENLQNGDYIDIASAVLDIGAAALAIAVVVALTRRQQARASALATIAPVVAPQSDSF
jgi:hypothetical protein